MQSEMCALHCVISVGEYSAVIVGKCNDFLLDGFAPCCLCYIFHKQGTWGITSYDVMVSLTGRHACLQ